MVRPLRWRLVTLGVVLLAFVSGWAGGTLARARAAVPDRAIGASEPAPLGAPPSCVDAEAMRANERLVAQLREQRTRSEAAESAAREAQGKIAAAASARAVPAAVSSSREEWARMARGGKVRLRTPCASPRSPRRFVEHSSGARRTAGMTTSGNEVLRRARAAGFAAEEIEALETAYARANLRTWEAMRAACSEGRLFAEALAESDPSSDADRISVCQASLLPDEAGVRAAMRHVAESRAAAPGARVVMRSPEERVAFALSQSVELLFEEMTHALGQEKAVQAIDYGVLCVNETSYDVEEP